MTKKIILLIVIIIAIVAGIYGITFLNELNGNSTKNGTDITFTIPEGSSTHTIAKILKKNGFIKIERAFIMRVDKLGYSGKLKYGTFTLNTGINKTELIEKLLLPGEDDNYIKVTIPEGYSVQQIGVKLEEAGLCSKDSFLKAVNTETFDYDFLEDIPNDVDYKLQGFLFPKTYSIKKGSSEREIIEVMLKQFESEFKDEYYNKAKNLDKSIYEIVNIASIIEREAKLDEERATIAGVIYNRLSIGMKLEMCATVQYALTDGLFNVSKISNADTQISSLYNTYRNSDLPIGPICNPGAKSIEAALSPEQHDYLYYHVEDEATGKHKFSKTYQEHLEN